MKEEKWEPLYSRILVRRKQTNKTAGGLYIPENSKEMRATEGEVVMVGSECTGVNVGDWVLYGKHAYHEKEIGGELFDMMNEEDVLCRKVKSAEASAQEA